MSVLVLRLGQNPEIATTSFAFRMRPKLADIRV
jgi:hypothetical protein